MVPEEDCPLQECERAELPHQVGVQRRTVALPATIFLFFLRCFFLSFPNFCVTIKHALPYPHTLLVTYLFSFSLPSFPPLIIRLSLSNLPTFVSGASPTFHSSSRGSVGRTAWLCAPSSTDTDLTSLTTPN